MKLPISESKLGTSPSAYLHPMASIILKEKRERERNVDWHYPLEQISVTVLHKQILREIIRKSNNVMIIKDFLNDAL